MARLGLEPWDIARAKEAKEEGIDLAREPAQRDAWLDGTRRAPARDPAADHHRRRRHHRRRPRPRLARPGDRRRERWLRPAWPTRPPATPSVERLGRLYAGRPVIVGPGILAGYTGTVVAPAPPRLRGAGPRPPSRAPDRSPASTSASVVEHRPCPTPSRSPRSCAPSTTSPTTCPTTRSRRSRRSTPTAAARVARQPVRHRRRADPRPPGRQRPAGRVHGAGGQAARRGDLGGGRQSRPRRTRWCRSTRRRWPRRRRGSPAPTRRRLVRRHPRRLQRRRQLRALGRRRGRPGGGRSRSSADAATGSG